MHHTQLDRRGRPDDANRFGQAGQPVAADDAHVTEPAGSQLGQHGEPEFARLPDGRSDPQAKHLLDALAVDPDRQVDRPVGHHTITDLDHQRVDEHHRIDRVKRPSLPLLQLVHDGIGDSADQVRSDVDLTHRAYISRRCPRMSRVVIPRAYRATMRSLNPSRRV